MTHSLDTGVLCEANLCGRGREMARENEGIRERDMVRPVLHVLLARVGSAQSDQNYENFYKPLLKLSYFHPRKYYTRIRCQKICAAVSAQTTSCYDCMRTKPGSPWRPQDDAHTLREIDRSANGYFYCHSHYSIQEAMRELQRT